MTSQIAPATMFILPVRPWCARLDRIGIMPPGPGHGR
jgi:hypothetical protein